jgi:hypothetical protein
MVALGIYLALCVVVFVATGSPLVVALALPGILFVGVHIVLFGYGLALLLAVRRTWSAAGVRCLVVYSNSPVWEAHIKTKWLPRFGDVAVKLNWSERASWRRTLAGRVFDHFCGSRNFNPAVVVFRGLRQPMVFRFFYAFQEVKAGRPQYMQRLESDLLDALGMKSAG